MTLYDISSFFFGITFQGVCMGMDGDALNSPKDDCVFKSKTKGIKSINWHKLDVLK